MTCGELILFITYLSQSSIELEKCNFFKCGQIKFNLLNTRVKEV